MRIFLSKATVATLTLTGLLALGALAEVQLPGALSSSKITDTDEELETAPTPSFMLGTIGASEILYYELRPAEATIDQPLTSLRITADGQATLTHAPGHRYRGEYLFHLTESELHNLVTDLLSTQLLDHVPSREISGSYLVGPPKKGLIVSDSNIIKIRIQLDQYTSTVHDPQAVDAHFVYEPSRNTSSLNTAPTVRRHEFQEATRALYRMIEQLHRRIEAEK